MIFYPNITLIKFLCGFCHLNSTETALLSNDILMKTDASEFSVLVLLDLTATFNKADHGSCNVGVTFDQALCY